jgi:hypothetical protein
MPSSPAKIVPRMRIIDEIEYTARHRRGGLMSSILSLRKLEKGCLAANTGSFGADFLRSAIHLSTDKIRRIQSRKRASD